MEKRTKKILLAVSVIAGVAALALSVKYILLWKSYSTVVTVQEADNIIDNATINIEDDSIIPDEVTDSADMVKGSEQELAYQDLSLQEYEIQSGSGDY